MAKWLFSLSLTFIIAAASADVGTATSNVTKCLTGSSSSGGGKSQCVQSAISAEGDNQISTFFQNYANYVNVGLSFYGAQTGTSTPNTPGDSAFGNIKISGGTRQSGGPSGNAGGTGESGGTNGGTSGSFYPEKKQAPAPASLAPPPPKQTGGIQYY